MIKLLTLNNKKLTQVSVNKTLKNMTLIQLSLILALGIIVIQAVFFLFVYSYQPNIIVFALCLFVAFITVFFGVRFVLSRFIYDRIKPIYKTIHDVNIGNKYRITNYKGDIIGQVEAEVEIYRNEKSIEIEKLKELERYRREFLGNVSHELKTPIFNIQGYILTLLDGGINDNNINLLYLKRAERSISRIITIVDDLETISNLDSGVMLPSIRENNLLRIVEEVYEMYQMKAEEKSILLKTNPQKQKQIIVYCDKRQIINVLGNLISNSIKYGKIGGIVEISFYDMHDKWLIEVKDNGIGIESQHINRIFERFYRIDKSRSRDEGGSGLGLAIVKHIIDAHNQTINVKSVLGEGTSFTFTLNKSINNG